MTSLWLDDVVTQFSGYTIVLLLVLSSETPVAFASIPGFGITIEAIPTLQNKLQVYPLYDQLQTYRV